VPEAGRQRDRSTTDRSDAARRADHAAIVKLADDLLPALMAKLGSSNLGELEVREGEWIVRLRRPIGADAADGRRATDRPSRSQPGHEGHGHGRAAPEGRGSRGGGATSGPSGVTAGSGAASASTNGTGAARNGAGGGSKSAGEGVDRSRTVATSPAVGIFQPGSRAASGTRVRAGDSLGTVNVIGVPQDVLAPADGIVGSTLVEGGTAVEYGQELIRIELAATAGAA